MFLYGKGKGKRRVLIYHDGALGDVMLSLPCITEIRNDAGVLHMAGRDDIVSFLLDIGMADEISSAGSSLYSSLYTDRPESNVSEFLSGFDQAIIFTQKKSSQFVSNFMDIQPNTKTVQTVPPEDFAMHIAEYRIKQLGYTDILGQHEYLRFSDDHMKGAMKELKGAGYIGHGRPILAIHPGSGGRHKQWPLEKFCSVAVDWTLQTQGMAIIISGPAEDKELKTAIDSFVENHSGIKHLNNRPLLTVAALIRNSVSYVGNDSGVSHLAAALGCNVTVIFGPTDPLLWRPAGRNVTVISPHDPKGGFSNISAASVTASLAYPLPPGP